MTAMKPSGNLTSVAPSPGDAGEARNRPGLLAHGFGWARWAAARCVACARALIGAMCPRGGGVGHMAPICARAQATKTPKISFVLL
jgi:hypothetical protein